MLLEEEEHQLPSIDSLRAMALARKNQGLPFMTSAGFSGSWTPSPSLCGRGRHMYMAPKCISLS